MLVCLLLSITDVWLLIHIFREVDLLTLADLAKSTLFMYNHSVVVCSCGCNYILSHAILIPKATTHTCVYANCLFVDIHALPHANALLHCYWWNWTIDTHLELSSLFQTHKHEPIWNVLNASRQEYEVHTSTYTPPTLTDVSVSSCVIREGNRYCHTEKSEQRKRPKWNWQTGGGVTGLKLICAPSLHLSHIVSERLPFIAPPSFYFFPSIYSHTFPVEVILKTRFGPIKLKLYSPSCGCLIESDIDTITTDKLD